MDVVQPAPQGAHYRTDVVNTNVFYSQKKSKAKLKGTILHNYWQVYEIPILENLTMWDLEWELNQEAPSERINVFEICI